jgi:hypothetical protein
VLACHFPRFPVKGTLPSRRLTGTQGSNAGRDFVKAGVSR